MYMHALVGVTLPIFECYTDGSDSKLITNISDVGRILFLQRMDWRGCLVEVNK